MDINDNLDPSTDVASRAAFATEGHQYTGAGKEIVSAESSGIEPGSSLFWLALGFLVKVTATLGGFQGTQPTKEPFGGSMKTKIGRRPKIRSYAVPPPRRFHSFARATETLQRGIAGEQYVAPGGCLQASGM